jgi:hypothetical protein
MLRFLVEMFQSLHHSNDLKRLHAISLKFVLELLFAFCETNIRIKKSLLGKNIYVFIYLIYNDHIGF